MFVLAQAVAEPSAGIIERLGTAGILVIAGAFLLRYFIGVVTKKDEIIMQMTEKFIQQTKQFAEITEENTHVMRQVQASTASVQDSVEQMTNQFRQTLGDSIVRAAHEAIKGAKEIAFEKRSGGSTLPGR